MVTPIMSADTVPRKMRALPRRLIMSEFFILYLCLFSFALLWLFVPVMRTPYNLANLLSNVWPLFAVAIGQTFVLILAGIDLSQGAVISLTSVVGAMLITTKADPAVFGNSPLWGTVLFENGAILSGVGWGLAVAIGAMLLAGALVGLINGLMIAYAGIPPFMVTLVTGMFCAALAIYLVKSENIINLPQSFTAIGANNGVWSYSLVIAVALAIVGQLVLSYTKFGRWLYAAGTNLRAAIVSGVPSRRVIVLAYAFSGFCAAVGSVLYSSRIEMGRPTLGDAFLLDIIGGVVIGGTSLAGGKGKILWTFFGIIFLTLLGNALALLNVPFFWIQIAKGAVILVAALLDAARTRVLQRSA
ncbi:MULTISPECIES: ABC transporter permease [Tessaracoccus]|uniref:ABC transporter permease n=1 Tax=Tessaracoccus TaxID=72763 RepID=UPI00166B8A5B|nr:MULTISPECIES: ABC transporter permease [Tessaracoccus]VEP41858.1 Ribose import permease protein RbsC [Tessaracoccus lapidicaptus]